MALDQVPFHLNSSLLLLKHDKGPKNVKIIDGPKPIHGNWSLPLIASYV